MSELTPAQELGRRGGQATLRKHGREHYRNAVNKRWAKNKKKKAPKKS